MSLDLRPDSAALRAAIKPFERPRAIQSIVQLVSTFALFIAVCAAMYAMLFLGVSYWLTLVLALPGAGLLVRLFTIQHDCGHGAYFRSRLANDIAGIVCSTMTLTPYASWRRQHARHHGNWNDLDRRAGTDVFSACLTVNEYRALSFWRRAIYRHSRNPVLLHVILPPFLFSVLYRLPLDTPREWQTERRSVYLTTALLVAVFAALGLVLGFAHVAMVQGPIIALASVLGVWLFAVQHRFEGAQWSRPGQWNPTEAALESCSYLQLPGWLNWFTGSIGFHHVHHLSPRVPNYRLRACHEAIPTLRAVAPLSIWSGLSSVRLSLWDDTRRRMVGFADVPAR